MNGCPTVPLADVLLEITGVAIGAGTNCTVTLPVPVPEEFVAAIDTVKLPFWVEVPVIAPVLVLRLRPAGRPEAAKLVGELVPAMV